MKPELQLRIQRYGWDRAAEHYDQSWQYQLRPAQDELLNMAELKDGEHVLDIACGTGMLSKRIARLIGQEGLIVGTDISDNMLAIAREALKEQDLPPTYFHRMESGQQEFPDATFDVALCSMGYMYFPNPMQSAKEQYRVLKPGGRAIVAVWGAQQHCGWAEIFPIIDKRVNTEVCPMFYHLGTGDTLNQVFWMAGFSKITSRRIPTTLYYSTPEAACHAIFSGGPVAMAYSRFDAKTQAEVHEEYLASIDAFRKGNGYAIPGEFVVTKGVR